MNLSDPRPFVPPHAAAASPGGTQLHCETHGRGPPVLLIHGFGASSYSWRHLVPALAERHSVVLVDLQGFGRSPKPPDARYCIHEQARLVAALVRERGLGRPTIGGHSFGGGVALLASLALAGDARHRPARLMLFDSIAYRQPLPLFLRVLRTPLVGPLGVRLVPDRMQSRYVLRLAYHDDNAVPPDAVEAYAAPLALPGAKRALVRTARNIVPGDIDAIAARYPSLAMPTLIVWGRQDAIVPLAVGERLHREIAGSRLVVFDRCGHIPHEERPDDARRTVLAFLDSS